VLFTGGVAAVSLATIMWLVDHLNQRRWTKFFVVYGMNPMVAFVGSGVMARLIYSILKVDYQGQTVSLQAFIYRTGFASWLEPRNASLAFALAFVALWYVILLMLHRRNIFFRV
jgi:predicted acyltransferase